MFSDREAIVKESGVTQDSVVLEIGAGNGFLTEVLAQNAKKVYAVELQERMIRKLSKRVRKFGDRISIIKGDISSVRLREDCADIGILYYSFHEFEEKERAAYSIHHAVKKGGSVSIYEPTIEVGKKAMLRTSALFEERGFQKTKERCGFFTRFIRLEKT